MIEQRIEAGGSVFKYKDNAWWVLYGDEAGLHSWSKPNSGIQALLSELSMFRIEKEYMTDVGMCCHGCRIYTDCPTCHTNLSEQEE